MPESSLPPEALAQVALAIDRVFVDEFGYGWNAAFIEEIAAVAAETVAPFLVPTRKPRIVCPVCSREVVKRDDGSPISHPTRDRAAACEHGHCRGGCRGCRP